jgi:glycosyltransferase involved in cell wall biosynthesis
MHPIGSGLENAKTVVQADSSVPCVAWAGLVYSSAGFGHEARSFIGALTRDGLQLKVISLGYNEEYLLPPRELLPLQALELTPGDISQMLVIQHIPFDFYRREIHGRINIVRTMFETTGIPDRWVQPLSQQDEVWVPSSFNIDTFSACGIPRHKLRLVPSGVDCSIFHPEAPPLSLEQDKRFTFLSNFVFTDRKGWDVLLTAYFTEFKPEDDVFLLIKTYGDEASIRERIGRFIQQHFAWQRLPQYSVIAARLHSSMLPGLYTACDAFVLPSRGEAWGLPYIEAMACGLPTLGTRWGGNLEYMNDENSYLIDSEGLEDVPGHIDTPVLIGYQWARPSAEHLRRLMRHVFEHPQEAKAKGQKARADICQQRTWEQAAAIARTELVKYGAC